MGKCTVGIPKGGVVGFKDVATDSSQALMSAVARQPVSIAIEADKPVFQLYKRGVLTTDCGTKLDHGVLVVGYGTDRGKDYWKVKNSWGATWGEKGYIRLTRGTKGPGECGLEAQPSYPVVAGRPGPSPPSPPPPPSPPAPPAPPSKGHYEEPPCGADEMAARVQGLGGSVCAPHCDSSACPTDLPKGTKAHPQCILKDMSGSHYCALVCHGKKSCPHGSKCGKIGPVGICFYPSDWNSVVSTTILDIESPDVGTINV